MKALFLTAAALAGGSVLLQGCTSTGSRAGDTFSGPSSPAATGRAGGGESDVTPYPFNHCAVIRKPFDEDEPKHRRVHEGQEVLFCCTPCVRAFDANPEPYMPRIIAAAKKREERNNRWTGSG